jgi:hypothetical protein
VNRQAVCGVGLLTVGIALAMAGCEDDPSASSGAEAGQAGQGDPSTSAGENSGGSGSVVAPQAGEGGMPQVPGGGGQPEGGTGVVVVQGGAGGVPAEGGAGGVPAEGGAGGPDNDSCVVPNAFGPAGSVEGSLFESGGGLAWSGDLELESPAFGSMEIELVPGFPPFENGVTTLTNHVLSGPDLNYGTCGLCLRLVTYPTGDVASLKHYYVTGGTITVSEVEDGMTGTASNLTFEEVTLNGDTFYTTPVPDGCETSISSIAFDESLATGGAGGAGG